MLSLKHDRKQMHDFFDFFVLFSGAHNGSHLHKSWAWAWAWYMYNGNPVAAFQGLMWSVSQQHEGNDYSQHWSFVKFDRISEMSLIVVGCAKECLALFEVLQSTLR